MREVVCTGISGTVGEAIVQRLAIRADLTLYAVGRSRPQGVDPSAYEFYGCDFLSEPALWKLPHNADVLINCAGVSSRGGDFVSMEWSDFADVFSVNAIAPMRLMQHFLPHMLAGGWGRIVNVNSIWGVRGTDSSLPYVVSKHALSGATRALAKDLAKTGVTVNDVAPAAIESRMMSRIARASAELQGIDASLVENDWKANQVGGRYVYPSEVVAAVEFLISDAASGVNGVTLPVDLGQIA